LLFDLHRHEEAEASYRAALAHDPRHFSAVFALAIALQNQGKKDEAIRYYREYLGLYPQGRDKALVESRIKWLENASLPTIFGYQLIDAAEQGFSSRVKLLLDKGADVTLKAEYKTALSAAASAGYLDIVKLLLAHGAKDDDGAAIAGAYEAGQTEIEKVLERAAPQPLSARVLNRLLGAAINRADVRKFATLLEAGNVEDFDSLLPRVVSQKLAPPTEMVRLLLAKGARINQPTRYKTVLMHAAREGHNEIVKLLLASGAEVNVETDEGTALMMAITGGHVETTRLLLAASADVNARHRSGDSPIIMAARASSPELNPVKGAPPPKPNSEIMQMLLGKGADVNTRGQWDRTALMHANSAAKVELLLAQGADPEAKDQDGQTALIKAASAGNAEVAEALLKKATVNAADRKGDTALIKALSDEDARYGDSALELVKRRLEVARRILLVRDLEVNTQNEHGETALMRAIRIGNIETIKSLLARGADPTRSDVLGNTAFVLAYEKNDAQITTLLESQAPSSSVPRTLNAFLRAAIRKKDAAKVQEVLAAGANPNYEYAIGYDHQGIKTTVLVEAAKAGHVGIVQMLLDKGADLGASGLIYGSESGLKFGTALEAAEYSQHAEVVGLLRKHLATRK
jgi:cytohesin